MKNFTTKLALFAFLSSLSLSIMPASTATIKELDRKFKIARQKFNDAQAPCEQAIRLALEGKNTTEYATEKCAHFHHLGLKALEAKKALDDAEKSQSILSRLFGTK